MEPGGPSAREFAKDLFSLAKSNANNKCQRKVLERVGGAVDKSLEALESTNIFLEGLDKILGDTPKRLREAEYKKLREWCAVNQQPDYAKRPRTFAVLRWIGCTDAMEGFVKEHLSDIAIPYSEENLPRAIRGTKARARFLECQQYVLIPENAANLEKEGRPHVNIARSADEYFYMGKVLGKGGFGRVDHVVGKGSLKHFALKRIPRGRSFKRDQNAIRSFENELKSLKNLSHHHLVKLISSYTDKDCVGLVMTPVADMNLAKYLSNSEIDPEDRKNCLREFYGCLATAIEYLHKSHVRHKDLKPENVLVLLAERRALITDFGTSHNWADDTKGTTSGTMKDAFTERYCAPEVVMQTPRNESTDIWSLGCIFIEMSTVLAGLTVAEMRQFFQQNGTPGHYIRNNRAAFDEWCAKIASNVESAHDLQVLELGKRMCSMDPSDRPTAAEAVSEIIDFDGNAYYCYSCDRDIDLFANVENGDNITATRESTATRTVTAVNHIQLKDSGPEADSFDPADPSNYRTPWVQDIQENMTVTYYDDASKAICKPRPPPSGLKPLTDAILVEANMNPLDEVPLPKISDEDDSEAKNGTTDIYADWRQYCQWPECTATWTKDADVEVYVHYRNVHRCHDFGRTPLLADSTALEVKDQPTDSPLTEERSFTLCSTPVEETPLDPYVADVNNRREELRKQRQSILKKEESDVRAATSDLGSEGSPTQVPAHGLEATHKMASDTSAAKSALIDPEVGSGAASKRVRFDPTTPESQSVAPKIPETASDTDSRPAEDSGFEEGLGGTEIVEPRISSKWSFLGTNPANEGVGAALPKSTLVPSYCLASTNYFTKRELYIFRNPALGGDSTPPLFVYGRLMFPSILKACAQSFIGEDGVYSEKFQRRLRCDSRDWARINVSLQLAAKQMTPACITGKRRFKVMRRSSAALVPDNRSYGRGEVHGFLIFGLSEEALNCLDHWHWEQSQKSARRGSSSTKGSVASQYLRSNVTAQIRTAEGTISSVAAVTYQWADAYLGPYSDLRDVGLDSQWDINDFIRCRAFTTLSRSNQGDDSWVDEEEDVASTIGVPFVMRGDALCQAVIEGNKDRMMDLLDRGYDVNAPCRIYGTALEAAAYKGHEDVLEELLAEGANVNQKGGQWRTPLIAATFKGHYQIAEKLLKNGANVLANGGQYISAMYQAVSGGNITLCKLLLEKGAWMTKEYQELLDLADEVGDPDIIKMIQEYDVKLLHRRRNNPDDESVISDNSVSDVSDSTFSDLTESVSSPISRYQPERRVSKKVDSLAIVRAVGMEALIQKGQPGKWTGIKLVRLFRTAIRHGLPETIVDKATPMLSSYQKLVDFMGNAMKEVHAEREARLSLPHGRVEELDSPTGSSPSSPVLSTRRWSDIPPRSRGNGESSHSRRASAPLERSRAPYAGVGANQSTGDAPSCASCEGRGETGGEPRSCASCGGSCYVWHKEGLHSSRIPCTKCLGRGVVLLRSERCLECHGKGTMAEPPPPYQA